MGMYRNRTDNNRPSCLICKQTFQPIGDESVCGRCEEQYVRRRRETIENQWEQKETQRKYVEICKDLLANAGVFEEVEAASNSIKSEFGQDSPALEHRLRDCFSRDLTPEEAMSEITEALKREEIIRNNGNIGCMIAIGIICIIFVVFMIIGALVG